MSKAVSANPVERAEAELEGLMSEFNELVGQGQDATDSASAEPDAPSEPDAATADSKGSTADDDSYKQRWETLQGIVRSKDAQINTLTAQIQQLMDQNRQVMEQVQSATQQQDSADTSASNLLQIASTISDKFGDEIGEVFAKFAQHIQKLEDSGQTLDRKLNEVHSSVSGSKAEIRMTELCPNWKTQDKDPGFIAWLQSNTAPYTTKPLIDVLNDSWSAGDIETAAQIFNDYAATINTKPAPSADPRETLVTPGSKRSSSPSVPASNQAKIWSEAEVNTFFRSVQNGAYRTRQAEAKQIEDEISLAYLENRVR